MIKKYSYRYSKNNRCSCGILITNYAIKCLSCSSKLKKEEGKIGRTGNRASNFRHGKYINNNYCIDCGAIITPDSAIYGNSRCKKCAKQGKLHSNYKDGRTLKKNYCLDCYKKITYNAVRCGSCAKKEQFKNPRNTPSFGKLPHHGKGNYYKNKYMRSSYEIAYARWLDFHNIRWQYESKTFDLGNTTYTPDFYLLDIDEYIEIKGWWRDNAFEKFNLFKILNPDENIKVLLKKDLKLLRVFNG